jgi:phospholipid transport system substrate-binding protein
MVWQAAARAGAPFDILQTEVNRVLDVLRDPALKTESAEEIREKKIWSIVDGVFDYTELSRMVLGRHWRQFNTAQKEEFTSLFSRLLGSVYIQRIMTYTDEKVVFERETMMTDTKAEVQTRIITESKEIPVHYRMILKETEWRIYDVVIEGISLIANYRSQLREILASKSPEDLLEILRKKKGESESRTSQKS